MAQLQLVIAARLRLPHQLAAVAAMDRYVRRAPLYLFNMICKYIFS
jgi:hypothetical protein